MYGNELIIAIVGLISSSVSGYVSFLFTKKKYHAEVRSNVIDNMQESLEFYKQYADDTRMRLEEYRQMIDELSEELRTTKRKLDEAILELEGLKRKR